MLRAENNGARCSKMPKSECGVFILVFRLRLGSLRGVYLRFLREAGCEVEAALEHLKNWSTILFSLFLTVGPVDLPCVLSFTQAHQDPHHDMFVLFAMHVNLNTQLSTQIPYRIECARRLLRLEPKW